MKQRKSVRLLILNSKHQLLLMRVIDPTTTARDGKSYPAFWCTLGGSMEAGETIAETVARELYEETGLSINDVKVGPTVWHGQHIMFIRGQETEMDESFVVIHTNATEFSDANFTADEKQVIDKLAWFSYPDILRSAEPIFPAILKTHLPDIIAGDYPKQSLKVDLSLLPS